jgi:hypothetical protein
VDRELEFFIPFFSGTGVWTQGLTLAKQALLTAWATPIQLEFLITEARISWDSYHGCIGLNEQHKTVQKIFSFPTGSGHLWSPTLTYTAISGALFFKAPRWFLNYLQYWSQINAFVQAKQKTNKQAKQHIHTKNVGIFSCLSSSCCQSNYLNFPLNLLSNQLQQAGVKFSASRLTPQRNLSMGTS